MYTTVRNRNRIDCFSFDEGLGRRSKKRVFYVRTEANGDKKVGSSSSAGSDGRAGGGDSKSTQERDKGRPDCVHSRTETEDQKNESRRASDELKHTKQNTHTTLNIDNQKRTLIITHATDGPGPSNHRKRRAQGLLVLIDIGAAEATCRLLDNGLPISPSATDPPPPPYLSRYSRSLSLPSLTLGLRNLPCLSTPPAVLVAGASSHEWI